MPKNLQDRSKLYPLAIVAVAVVVGASLILALTDGAPTASSSDEPAAPGQVEIAGFKFNPEPVTVDVGTKVSWTNVDSAPHTATADDGSFDTGDIAEGGTGTAVFDKPGEFPYVCDIHPYMTGTVVVE